MDAVENVGARTEQHNRAIVHHQELVGDANRAGLMGDQHDADLLPLELQDAVGECYVAIVVEV